MLWLVRCVSPLTKQGWGGVHLFGPLAISWQEHNLIQSKVIWLSHSSLEPRLSIPDFASQLWRKNGGKAWKDFSRDTVALWRQSTIRESNTSHGMFLLCIAEGLRERCKSQNQVQGDRVTWLVGSLFTKRSYSSRLDILVVTVLPKYWSLCMRTTKKPFIRSANWKHDCLSVRSHVLGGLQPMSANHVWLCHQ